MKFDDVDDFLQDEYEFFIMRPENYWFPILIAYFLISCGLCNLTLCYCLFSFFCITYESDDQEEGIALAHDELNLRPPIFAKTHTPYTDIVNLEPLYDMLQDGNIDNIPLPIKHTKKLPWRTKFNLHNTNAKEVSIFQLGQLKDWLSQVTQKNYMRKTLRRLDNPVLQYKSMKRLRSRKWKACLAVDPQTLYHDLYMYFVFKGDYNKNKKIEVASVKNEFNSWQMQTQIQTTSSVDAHYKFKDIQQSILTYKMFDHTIIDKKRRNEIENYYQNRIIPEGRTQNQMYADLMKLKNYQQVVHIVNLYLLHSYMSNGVYASSPLDYHAFVLKQHSPHCLMQFEKNLRYFEVKRGENQIIQIKWNF